MEYVYESEGCVIVRERERVDIIKREVRLPIKKFHAKIS